MHSKAPTFYISGICPYPEQLILYNWGPSSKSK